MFGTHDDAYAELKEQAIEIEELKRLLKEKDNYIKTLYKRIDLLEQNNREFMEVSMDNKKEVR